MIDNLFETELSTAAGEWVRARVAAQMSVQSHIITQERNLAISIPTRNEQIDKRDRKPRKKTSEQAPGARKLRIA